MLSSFFRRNVKFKKDWKINSKICRDNKCVHVCGLSLDGKCVSNGLRYKERSISCVKKRLTIVEGQERTCFFHRIVSAHKTHCHIRILAFRVIRHFCLFISKRHNNIFSSSHMYLQFCNPIKH